MLNCKETTRLISEGLDRRLLFWQRFNLRFHVLLCGACRTYKKQVESLHKLLISRRQSSMETPHATPDMSARLSDQKRKHIKEILDASK